MQSLPTIESLLSRQRRYYEILSAQEPRAWGTMGANLQNPTSHDSNHAFVNIKLTAARLPEILAEVKEWYSARNLQPRLRFFMPPNDLQLVHLAESLGWKSASQEETWRIWPCTSGCEPPNEVEGLVMKFVGAEALEDILAIHNEGAEADTAFRRRQVWNALSNSSHAECLLGYINGEPAASFACVWNGEWGSIEDVETRACFRRRGICHALLRTLQQHAVTRRAAGLYLYHVEEGPGRIYANVGFQELAKLLPAHIWWEG